MARTPDGAFDAQTDTGTIRLNADAGSKLDLPSNDFVTDAQMLRDGQDLILRAPDGQEVIVENYFTADPAPVLVSAQGAALTPDLVDSFVEPIDGVQFAQKGSVDDVSPVGMVKEVSGESTVTHPNGTVENIAVGTPIYQGDIIETKGDGAVNITFVDDTTFAVSENARLAIDEYVFDPATQSGETNFSVLRGVFVFTSGLIGREDPDDVQIDTPVGSIGIRGTTIMGTINPDGESQISVVEGAIVVRNGTGEQTLSQQFETVRLTGFDQNIVNHDQMDANQIGESYNVLRTVTGQLFSQIDDAGTTEDTQTEGEGQTGEEAAPEGETTPDAAPAEGQNGESGNADPAGENAPVLADAVNADGDAGFDTSAEIEAAVQDKPIGRPGDIAADFSPANNPPPVNTLPPPVAPEPPPPPPTVIGGGAGGANGGGGSSNGPDLNLHTLIGTGAFIGNPFGSGSTAMHGADVMAAGDYNHDGITDFAFTAGADTYFAVNASIHDYLANYSLGGIPGKLAYIGDFNKDGIGDFALGSENASPYGRVVIIDGSSMGTLATINFTTTSIHGGASISAIGDVDGDGFNDFLIGTDPLSGTRKAFITLGTDSITVTSETQYSTVVTDPEGYYLTGSFGSGFAHDIAGLGDFNNDGKDDFAISSPGDGKVAVYFGNTLAPGLQIAGINIGTDDSIPVVGLGNFNQGNKTDFALAEIGTNTLHVFFGETGHAGVISVASSDLKIFSSAANTELFSGGSAGDFNGDGYNDIAVAMRHDNLVDIYVLYGGRAAMMGSYDLTGFTDQDGFRMTLDLLDPDFNYPDLATINSEILIGNLHISINTVGDRNGDGYDDLMIGLPTLDADGGSREDNGGLVTVMGRPEAGGQVITVGTVGGFANATADNQTLHGLGGNNNLYSLGHMNLHFIGGGGNDQFMVSGATQQAEFNGGTGIDEIRFSGTGLIDLSILGDNLSGIEKISLLNPSMTLKLGIDEIFSLLQESQSSGQLKIDGPAGAALQIDDNGGAATSLASLGFTLDSVASASDAYTYWDFGNYTLVISDAVNASTTVV